MERILNKNVSFIYKYGLVYYTVLHILHRNTLNKLVQRKLLKNFDVFPTVMYFNQGVSRA